MINKSQKRNTKPALIERKKLKKDNAKFGSNIAYQEIYKHFFEGSFSFTGKVASITLVNCVR